MAAALYIAPVQGKSSDVQTARIRLQPEARKEMMEAATE